ncbi:MULTISPECIES: hypothetical protein [unclassified Sphingomonas]|uniref:hypothetical protein n=1 Tax=unclassified Sphingomonas TaxID=196159 RepID=UPI0006F93C13|nr:MULTISPECIES: hypothetical protein [unclassified Sphingomonas]KQN14044.1 hypothetical protein ASE89_09790 [Sphingomonas sp. Leaf30]MBD8550915.1 hypothetical protein [Sphingomonas sp. CFBP 8764]
MGSTTSAASTVAAQNPTLARGGPTVAHATSLATLTCALPAFAQDIAIQSNTLPLPAIDGTGNDIVVSLRARTAMMPGSIENDAPTHRLVASPPHHRDRIHRFVRSGLQPV